MELGALEVGLCSSMSDMEGAIEVLDHYEIGEVGLPSL